MPAYPAATPVMLDPGSQVVLIASNDSGVTKTIQVGIANITPTAPTLMLVNTTNEPATVMVAATDGANNYATLEGVSCGAGQAISFLCGFPLVLASFAVAPTQGMLTLLR